MLNDKVFYACQPWLQSVFEGRVRGGFYHPVFGFVVLCVCACTHACTCARVRV